VTSVRCGGKWLPLGISVNAMTGMTLSIDRLSDEETDELKAWLEPILDAVDADVLVTDDADAFKKISDETGRAHQVCKSHVEKNTDVLVEELSSLIQAGNGRSLDTLEISSEQALADLAMLKKLIHSRQPEDQVILEQLHLRYAAARKPGKGRFNVAYRMRNLFLDHWTLWPRLTFYRTWRDKYGNPHLDGTNNDCERSIGWWVKERYRFMRSYKREQSGGSQCEPPDCSRWKSLVARIKSCQFDGVIPFTFWIHWHFCAHSSFLPILEQSHIYVTYPCGGRGRSLRCRAGRGKIPSPRRPTRRN
jgi:hypothetical protein